MANTYTQINIHSVFAVKGRKNLLHRDVRERIFEYIGGTIRGIGLYPLAVNGISDHVHVFFELPPGISISKALQDIKSNSSRWINENQIISGKFEWQRGFGAFSYSRTQRKQVIQYILNQEKHHQTRTFRDEYLELMRRFEINYNEPYLFEFYV
jgi:putative transposase